MINRFRYVSCSTNVDNVLRYNNNKRNKLIFLLMIIVFFFNHLFRGRCLKEHRKLMENYMCTRSEAQQNKSFRNEYFKDAETYGLFGCVSYFTFNCRPFPLLLVSLSFSLFFNLHLQVSPRVSTYTEHNTCLTWREKPMK